jgi:uncharacterized protein
MSESMHVQVIDSLEQIAADEWNGLQLKGNPFVRYEFLAALETNRCATRATGWQAQHLLLRDDQGVLLAAMPLYRKAHSWGEFVFDFAWANAYAQFGLEYYPKLVSAVPFTPATGPRLLITNNTDNITQLRKALLTAAIDFTKGQKLSSLHLLFADEADQLAATELSLISRQDCQFHWHNRDYRSFDDFIATFRADKRKKILRERRRVFEAGVRFTVCSGEQMSEQDWQIAFAFSERTFAQHGHEHYLNIEFFKQIAHSLPQSVVVIWARVNDQPIATAICFKSDDTLYGRYWGSLDNYHSLHFETCYLQGIEYCIANNLKHFEPGTQGEHKVARGFEPTLTHSYHWIADARLRSAIADHVKHEANAVENYAESVNEHLPFHRGE